MFFEILVALMTAVLFNTHAGVEARAQYELDKSMHEYCWAYESSFYNPLTQKCEMYGP